MLKKVFLTVLVAILVVGTTNVNAMTQKQLEEKITKSSYTINGEKVEVNSQITRAIEQYLSDHELDPGQIESISSIFDEMIKVFENAKVTSYDKLTKAQKNDIKGMAEDALYYLGLELDIQEDKVVITENGEEIFAITKDVIRYTDNNTILMAAGVVSLLGIAVVTRKIAKANA